MNGHEFKSDCWCHPIVEGPVVKHNTDTKGDMK